jgi:hypothetical protein
MLKGRESHLAKHKPTAAALPSARAPQLAPPAERDPRKLDWSKAGLLEEWGFSDGQATDRRIEGRIAHDGECLYLWLRERLDTAGLVRDAESIWGGDDWELFFAGRRTAHGATYRQLGVDAQGRTAFLAYGAAEAGNFLGAPPTVEEGWNSGAVVHSDASAPDCWSVYIALPLDRLLAGMRVKPGDTIYLNVVRATQGKIAGAAMWVPTLAATFHATDRLGKIVLGKADGGF